MAIEDIPHPGDTDLAKLPPPKEGERWSITRWGVQIDGVGPFEFDDEALPQSGAPHAKSEANALRRAARVAGRQ